MVRSRLEVGVILEVGDQRECDLIAHLLPLVPPPSPPQMLQRSDTTSSPIADKAAALLFHSRNRKSIAFLRAPLVLLFYSGAMNT
jgi:hypothetical protein